VLIGSAFLRLAAIEASLELGVEVDCCDCGCGGCDGGLETVDVDDSPVTSVTSEVSDWELPVGASVSIASSVRSMVAGLSRDCGGRRGPAPTLSPVRT